MAARARPWSALNGETGSQRAASYGAGQSMSDRRQILAGLAAACGLAPIAVWLTGRPQARAADDVAYPLGATDLEWRRRLTPSRYRILRGRGTERAFTSELEHETRAGLFLCAGCGRALFSSAAKFDSGTGWPSFWQPVDGAVATAVDTSWLMIRTEVHCAACGGHLGHVFSDGPRPTGLRYCINGLALTFAPGARPSI